MWIEKRKYQEINSAVKGSAKDVLEHVLLDILKRDSSSETMPARCPICKKELVRKSLPYLEFLVRACPEFHGVWMSPEMSKKLEHFISEQISVASQKHCRLKFLNRTVLAGLLALLALLIFLMGSETITKYVHLTADGIKAIRISEEYWPRRGEKHLRQIPLKDSAIYHPQELRYFQSLMEVMEEGISHRMNMHDVLHLRKSPEQYGRLFQIYEENQSGVLSLLASIPVPGRLMDFHEHLVNALKAQIHFYRDFTEFKIQNPSTHLKSMLAHPDLQTCNQELLAAWDLFNRHYPQLDPRTRDAVYDHFCWLDIV